MMTPLHALILVLALQEKPPDAPAVAEAEKSVKALFKDDYGKKTPKDRAFLAKKLLDQARESKDAPASQYVLYREAQDNFAQGGELAASFEAIDEWARRFVIDAVDLKVKSIAAAAKLAKTPEEGLAIGAAHLKAGDAAAQADRFDVAEKEVQAAIATAKKLQNVPALNRAMSRSKEISDQKAVFEKLKKSRDALAANPEDAEANLAVGKYQCFIKGFWDAGLPLLAKGSEASLKDLAAKDLAGPKDPGAQAEIGDQWWEVGEKSAGTAKLFVRGRAAAWYDRAIPKLKGLPRMKADQRASEFHMAQLFQGSWADIDPKSLVGKTGETEPPPTGFHYKVLNQVPAGSEYDAASIRIRATGKEPGNITIAIESMPQQTVYFDQVAKLLTVQVKEGGSSRRAGSAPFETKDEYVLTLVLTDGQLAVFLDGREKFRIQTDLRVIRSVRYDRLTGSYSLDQLKLRKKA